jgi:hypothetical protein
MIWYDMIHLTAIGLTPGGSSMKYNLQGKIEDISIEHKYTKENGGLHINIV